MPSINKVVFGNTTLIDLTDSTLSDPNQLASGITAYDRTGTKITGTASGGTAAISVVDTTDSHGGTVRTITALDISDTTAVASDVAQGKWFYTSDGTKTEGTSSGGGSGATQHTIHLEFTDSTDTDIEVDYDDPWIDSLITSTEPTTYGAKTISSAALDGTVWYLPTATWETIYDVQNKEPNPDTPYNYFWLSENDLGDVSISIGSVWRVTIDDTSYILTARYVSEISSIIIGNPLYGGGTDDGSGVPFDLYNAGWGAWVGDTDLPVIGYHIVIERQVTS